MSYSTAVQRTAVADEDEVRSDRCSCPFKGIVGVCTCAILSFLVNIFCEENLQPPEISLI